MSAFRKFDPWAEIAEAGGGPPEPAKAPKAAPALPEPHPAGATGRAAPASDFRRFRCFRWGEPARDENSGSEGTPPDREPGSGERSQPAWDSADWRAYFDEQGAAAEDRGGADRATARRWAFEACVTRWLDLNPPPDDPGRCAHSGEPLPEDGGDAVAVLRGGGGHTWVRVRHLGAWRARRRAEAVRALNEMGIGPCPTS